MSVSEHTLQQAREALKYCLPGGHSHNFARALLEAERGRRIAEAVLEQAGLGADYSLCIEEAGRHFDAANPAWFGEEAVPLEGEERAAAIKRLVQHCTNPEEVRDEGV